MPEESQMIKITRIILSEQTLLRIGLPQKPIISIL